MKILYDNLALSYSTRTVSSADPNFPVSNINLLASTDEWRSVSSTTTATITYDLGSAKAVDFVGLVGNVYTRALPAATVLLEADTTNSFMTTAIGARIDIGDAGSASSGDSVQMDAAHILVVHGNSTRLTAIVVNPTSLSPTGSTLLHMASVDSIAVAKLDATRAVIVFRDVTDTNALKALVVSISGYTITTGNLYTFGTACTQKPNIVVACESGQYAVIGFRHEATQYPTVLALYYGSSTSVQQSGSRVTVASVSSHGAQALASHSSTDALFVYRISSTMLRGSVITRSHVTLTANTPADIVAGDYPKLVPIADTSTTHLIAYFDSNGGKSRQITISGTTFSVGSSIGTTSLGGAPAATSLTRMSATKFVVGYGVNTRYGFYTITLSGATTTQSYETDYSGDSSWTGMAGISATQFLFVDASSDRPGARLITKGAAFSQSLTVVPGEALAFSSFATKTYRYWRLTFSNPTGSYTGCSAIYLGTAFEFADNCFGTEIMLEETDLSAVSFSNTGRRFIDVQSSRIKTLSLNLNSLNKAEAGQWRDFTNYVGKHKPFFLMVDDSYLVIDTEQVLSGQFMFNDSPGLTQREFGFWYADFKLTEVV
jgi:hypothetical protein